MALSERSLIALFVFLLVVCAALMILSNFLGPIAREQVLPVATDGFKTVLGATVGALSVALCRHKDG